MADSTQNQVGLQPIEIATIDAMVCVFESERPGDYGAIAASATDPGGLSYGKHQAALVPGTLHKLISSYCALPNAGYGAALTPFLEQMAARDRQLDSNGTLQGLLRTAAGDPVMREVQDNFFATEYMGPALAKWREFGFQLPLSAGVIYDSYIQSGAAGFERLAAKVEVRAGKPNAEIEKGWIEAYIAERRKFLESSASKNVRNSVVRMATWEALISSDNWRLKMPLRVLRPGNVSYPLTPWDLSDHLFQAEDLVRRGGAAGFGVAKAGDASGPNGRDRFVQSSLMSLAILPQGAPDGVFGKGTTAAVRAFQKRNGLKDTGIVSGEDFDQICDEVEVELARARASGSDGLIRITPTKHSTEQATLSGAGAAVAVGGGAIAVASGSTDSSAPSEPATPLPIATPAIAATAAPGSAVTPAAPATPISASTQAPMRTYDIPVVGHVPSATIAVILAVAMVAAVLLVSLGLRKSY